MTDNTDQEKQELAKFEKKAWSLATHFKRDVQDIRGAYNDKRESLSEAFERVSGSKMWRNANLVLTVGLLLTPVRFLAVIPAVFAYANQRKINEVGRQLTYEVTRYRALPPPVPQAPAEPPKPPPAPLI